MRLLQWAWVKSGKAYALNVYSLASAPICCLPSTALDARNRILSLSASRPSWGFYSRGKEIASQMIHIGDTGCEEKVQPGNGLNWSQGGEIITSSTRGLSLYSYKLYCSLYFKSVIQIKKQICNRDCLWFVIPKIFTALPFPENVYQHDPRVRERQGILFLIVWWGASSLVFQ